ncbi:acetate--CoA ligase [Deinococcus cellulosilyticus]|uniref:Acetyl-coenzyme A synthetase n=1 Tax=Deinococcus cellulosilyticus (strain DSM 18568 / NBRC 106333 / KACC 11606 / 5516J-15) TaxID=1223518 RepID=A0A511MXS2_DEIC1|nr:acetate--CoA ligase [Deinococcus cellulosilyticus]GEM45360.1 acetyl-coenzyme A synthetase [Deinococcus cellulosilyticus NBRC 106333 = KACC 11606]
MSDKAIENVLHENRTFQPSEAYTRTTSITREVYEQKYQQSIENPEAFWGEVAQDLHWFEPYSKVLDWNEPFAQWFVEGKTNLSYNALDRHLEQKGNKTAIIWEGEDGEVRTYTYAELTREVKKFSNVLLNLGVQTGDRVTIYLPMIPEAAFAMLACARIGAVHSVVFGGFSSGALSDRINDAGSKVLITADGGYRRGSAVPLKRNADDAAENTPSLQHILVIKRTGQDVNIKEGRDVWYHEAVQNVSEDHDAVPLDAQHPHFILYTSGSTGKPKGVLHALGGYMVNTYLTTQTVFDLKEDDIYWCTADVGWITGHSYIVYGPLLNGATVLMYEGAPNHPDWGRFWKIIEDHKVTILYTAPTAIRSFMRAGSEYPNSHDLSSLRLLGSVGEPINPEAWIWYYTVIGKEKCPVVDTWWQTETGSIMITTLPGAHTMKPGSAGVPMYGVDAAIVDADGHVLGANEGGFLVVRKPWPSMLRTVYGDDNRYKTQYWGEIPHVYFAGDGARRDQDGYFTIVGRIDDVLNVSGHRLGTMEVESALVSHPAVAEAAVVGRPDPIKGEGIVAFVTLQTGFDATEQELKAHVAKEIGAIARPDDIRFAEALPKTRSGKIMRRLLRQIAAGQEIKGDTSTLEDVSVIEKLQKAPQQ